MNGTLLTIIIISVIGYLIFAIHFNYKVYKYIWKPGTMVLIILLAITESGLSSAFSYLVLFALLFSLFGDVFLLREEWFVHGLASFLIAHILYSIGIVVAFDLRFTFTTSSLLIILMMIAILFFLILQPNVRKNGGWVLLLAIAGYITVITTMVGLSIMTGVSILITASILFFISDAVLAFNKFVKKFQLADYIVMSTYFIAQLLFAISLGGH
ncbi:lysoplasmalogenase [Paucisalibacillus globulus]|uniref:lysoplasmalogenase n=1 Tax=Paucisalibacillus globulus TaxID=351095 RepID=UPI000BB91171|nr:lysoplasmalogenase [Paucisalibacillus globulus]